MKWLTIIGTIIADVIIKLIAKAGPTYHKGKVDKKKRDRLRDKAKKDGWNV